MPRRAETLPALHAVERGETLAQRVHAGLRQALLTGTFTPGQRMTVRALAAAMQVSVTPAREALGWLVAEGALEFTDNRTVVVPVLSAERLREVYRLRVQLEGMAAEEGARHLPDGAIRELERVQAELNAAMDVSDYKTVLQRNERFHFTLYEASGMPLAVRMIVSLWLLIGPTLNLLYPAYQRTRRGIQHHHTMIKALKAGKPEAVRTAMEQDLRDGERWLSSLIGGAAPSAPVAAPRRRARA